MSEQLGRDVLQFAPPAADLHGVVSVPVSGRVGRRPAPLPEFDKVAVVEERASVLRRVRLLYLHDTVVVDEEDSHGMQDTPAVPHLSHADL